MICSRFSRFSSAMMSSRTLLSRACVFPSFGREPIGHLTSYPRRLPCTRTDCGHREGPPYTLGHAPPRRRRWRRDPLRGARLGAPRRVSPATGLAPLGLWPHHAGVGGRPSSRPLRRSRHRPFDPTRALRPRHFRRRPRGLGQASGRARGRRWHRRRPPPGSPSGGAPPRPRDRGGRGGGRADRPRRAQRARTRWSPPSPWSERSSNRWKPTTAAPCAACWL